MVELLVRSSGALPRGSFGMLGLITSTLRLKALAPSRLLLGGGGSFGRESCHPVIVKERIL